MLRLIQPSLKYKTSYLRAMREMIKHGEHPREDYALVNLPKQIKRWKSFYEKKNSVFNFWLVDGKNYLGHFQLRRPAIGRFPNLKSHVHYSINPSKRAKGYGILILKLGLQKAKSLGFKRLTITCREKNIASRKIIEANGGKLLGKLHIQGNRERMWILKFSVQV